MPRTNLFPVSNPQSAKQPSEIPQSRRKVSKTLLEVDQASFDRERFIEEQKGSGENDVREGVENGSLPGEKPQSTKQPGENPQSKRKVSKTLLEVDQASFDRERFTEEPKDIGEQEIIQSVEQEPLLQRGTPGRYRAQSETSIKAQGFEDDARRR